MSFKLKRLKGGLAHFAAEFAKAGNVTKWVKTADQALVIAKELVPLIKQFHDKRANVGELIFEPVEKPKPVEPKVEPKPEPKPAAVPMFSTSDLKSEKSGPKKPASK